MAGIEGVPADSGAVRIALLRPLLKPLRDRRMLWVGWLVIVVQCAALLWFMRPWMLGDSAYYLVLANSLAHGNYGALTQAGFEPDVLRPPGYPAILWLLGHVLRLPLAAIVAVQLGAYCTALYALQRFLDARGVNPVPFVAIAAIYPFPLLYSACLLAEPWVMLATTLAAILAIRGGTMDLALAGVLAGLAAMVRSDLLLLPFVFAGVALARDFRSGLLAALGKAALPVVAASLVVLPYASWNFQKFGRFSPVPMAGAVGTSLYLSTWQGRLSEDEISSLKVGRVPPHARSIGLVDEAYRINRQIGASEGVRLSFDPYFYPTNRLRMAAAGAYFDAGLRRVEEDPRLYAGHVIRNIWNLWITRSYPANIPPLLVAALKLSCWLVLAAGFVGLAAALVRPAGWIVPWGLVPIAFYPAAVHLGLHTEARYTAAARPLLIMFAGALAAWALEQADERLKLRMERGPPIASGT